MCAGQKLNAEDVYPALEMFTELLKEGAEFQNQKGEPCASVGDFMRAEVQFLECLEIFFFFWPRISVTSQQPLSADGMSVMIFHLP